MDCFTAGVRLTAIYYDLAAVIVSPSCGLFVYFFVFVCRGNGELDGLFYPIHRFCNSQDCFVNPVPFRDLIPSDQSKYVDWSKWIADINYRLKSCIDILNARSYKWGGLPDNRNINGHRQV